MSSCVSDNELFDPAAVGTVQARCALAPLTHYRLGGPAEWFVRPQSVDQLAEMRRRCREANVPFRMLGRGANVLVDDDGVSGVVVHLDARCFTDVAWVPDIRPPKAYPAGEPVIVRVGAGADMARLTLASVRRGLTGLECMAGIPGSLGGIVRMNAGGRWGEIGQVVHNVQVIDPAGQVRTLDRAEVGFSYRHTQLDGFIVCGATLQLMPDDPAQVKQRYDDIWAAKKAAQPLAAHSAGCVFKNPAGQSAGQLIDRAGLKNKRIGTAFVSPEHANFIVAGRNGRARDVLDLIAEVRRTVAERFAVNLELEIDVWR